MVRYSLQLAFVLILVVTQQACITGPPPEVSTIASPTQAEPQISTALPTRLIPSTTAMKAQPTVSPSPDSCSPSNIDAFKASLLPLLDEIAVVSREATQLSALPDDRVAELSTQSTTLYNKIAATQAPDCLEGARDAALEGASLLVQAIGSIASGDYPQAESSLRASFESVAQAAAIIAIQTWETTATSTPAH